MSRAAPTLFDTVAPTRPVAPAASLDDEHLCAVCGRPGGFGFGVFLRRGIPGRWSCFAHRDQVEALGAGGGPR